MPDLVLPDQYKPDDLKRLLDDRFRRVGGFMDFVELTSDADAAGYSLTSLRDPRDGGDAVNLRTLRRELVKGSSQGGSSSSTTTTTGTTQTISQQIVLTRSGILAIKSNAFPLFQLPSSRSVGRVLAIGKQAPVASGTEQLSFNINIGGVLWTKLNVASGVKSAAKSAAGLAAIAANALITVDITSVGLTFGGADWSVILELA